MTLPAGGGRVGRTGRLEERMKRIIFMATMAMLVLTGIALAGGTIFSGHATNDPQASVQFEKGGGKVKSFGAGDLK